jgi:hypothetical protein
LNVFDFYKTFPQSDLLKANGILKTQKVWKNSIPMFVGEGKTGICHFSRCKKKDVSLIEGKNISVQMDVKNNIFEISFNNIVIFGEEDVKDERDDIKFRSLICMIFLAFSLFLLVKDKYASEFK